ncbi:MAG: XamI family restriction endonuclease [Thermodesulfobacteriota bacterium]
MAVNRDKPDRWKKDIARSVDLYNDWFLKFAPKAFRDTRVHTTKEVEASLKATRNFTDIRPDVLRQNPGVLASLRMSTCPPIAKDRLVGLTGVPKSIVARMEQGKLPVKLKHEQLDAELGKIGKIIQKMADPDIFTWLERKVPPTAEEIHRAATIVADRLCGATANPIVRNAQEARQLSLISEWLDGRGYKRMPLGSGIKFDTMPLRTYAFHANVPARFEEGSERSVNISIDVAVMRTKAQKGDLPLLIEAKSAGDFTNVNKRRKEEAMKISLLRRTYGETVDYLLFLCGYFDSGYLGYEAAEGIDWVWEHRIDDLVEFGL